MNVDCGIDYWLNNLMLDAEATLLCHQDNFIVHKAEVIETGNIPTAASFNPEVVLADGKRLLENIRNAVREEGNTYWLYRGKGGKCDL